MKLKKGIVLGNIDGQDFAIATGKLSQTVSGIINNNESANYIFKLLQKDQTEDSIVDAMVERYDAEESVIRADVRELLAKLDEFDILEK